MGLLLSRLCLERVYSFAPPLDCATRKKIGSHSGKCHRMIMNIRLRSAVLKSIQRITVGGVCCSVDERVRGLHRGVMGSVPQVLGTVPTISINKTEGCQVYLSKDSIHCDIVSAKSSAMNILVPVGDDDFVSNDYCDFVTSSITTNNHYNIQVRFSCTGYTYFMLHIFCVCIFIFVQV